MPVLSLTGNDRQDAHFVLVTMLHPNEEERRSELLAQIHVAETAEGTIPVSIAKQLLRAIPFDDDMFDKKNKGVHPIDGWYACNLLLYMALMESGGENSSKRKALYLLGKRLFGGRTFEGKGVPYSSASLEASWSKFRSVAHLWAAWNSFLTDDQSRIEGDWSLFMDGRKPIEQAFRCFSKESLPEFLALAEWFREFGENHNPQKQKYGTTLRHKTTWCVPPAFDLPKLRVSLEMPEWMRDALKEYRVRS